MDVFEREALSEYITVEEKEISIKSQNISFEQATAIPVLASAALQIFKTLVNLEKMHRNVDQWCFGVATFDWMDLLNYLNTNKLEVVNNDFRNL